MAMDGCGVACCCCHRYRSRDWDLAPPRAFVEKAIYTNQVQISDDLVCSWLTLIAHRRRRIITSHLLQGIFWMIRLWQLWFSRMGTGNFASRTTLVPSDVRFVLHKTIDGALATYWMPARTFPTERPPIQRSTRRWQSLSLTRRYLLEAGNCIALRHADWYVDPAVLRFEESSSDFNFIRDHI